MREIIRKVLKNPGTNVVIGMTPREASDALQDYKWNIVQDYLAESREDWSCTEYVSEYCPLFKITMQWNGWTGQVELVATCIEEKDTLTEDLKQGLEKVLATTYSVVEYRDCDFFDVDAFIENQGWELYRATCIFQPGWCHYIYGNDNYPDLRLVLAWKLDNKIAALWTMDSDMVKDEPSYEEYNL